MRLRISEDETWRGRGRLARGQGSGPRLGLGVGFRGLESGSASEAGRSPAGRSGRAVRVGARAVRDGTSSVTMVEPASGVSSMKLGGRFSGISYPGRSSTRKLHSFHSRNPASGTPGASHVLSESIRSAPRTKQKSLLG